MNSTNKNNILVVDGWTDHCDIADIFANRYRSLYNSVKSDVNSSHVL